MAVAEELHFTRAATRLHMAQPPLSQQIKSLEDEIGAPLLRRTSRHVELTPAGEALLTEARQTLAQADRALEVAQAVGHTLLGRLHLGFVDSSIYLYLPHLLRAFRKAHPKIHVSIRQLPSGEQVEALQRNELHVGLMRRTPLGPQLRLEQLGSERLVVAIPIDHPLTSYEIIAPSQLRNVPIVFPHRSAAPGLRDHLTGLLKGAGVTPQIAGEAREGHSLIGLVASGLGVSILAESLAIVNSDAVAYRPLAGSDGTFGMYLAWRRGERSPTVLSFLETARKVRERGVLPHR